MQLFFCKLTAAFVFFITYLNSSTAIAGMIYSFGDLSTDVDGSVITNTVTGRQYLRFDSFNLTYAETLQAVDSGGIYSSWSIADSGINDDFINAAFGQQGENPCSTGADYALENCGTLSGWQDGAFGASYVGNLDYYAYLSTVGRTGPGGTNPIGITEFAASGRVSEYEAWSSIANLDSNFSPRPINLLLYREASDIEVPEPATLFLLTFALFGLAVRKIRQPR